MSVPEAIIFDMDGVLVDSETHWKEVESSFLRGLLSAWDDALQQSIIGMSMYDVHALLCRDYGLSISREEFVSYYDALADEIYGSCVAEIPGISDLVKMASSWVPGLGVCSSSPLRWIDIVLRRFQLASYFQVIVSAQELDGRGKPDPAIYLLTAKRLGVQPGRVLAIEDSEKGIKSAKTAGMKCIGLSNGFNKPQDLVQADFIAQSTAAITLETVRGLFA